MGDFTWNPSAEQIAATNVARLARTLECEAYEELHAVSVDEPDRFWRAVVADLGLPLARTWNEVLDESRGIEWATWFVGARLNIADACVHRWAREVPDREAAVWAPEEGERRSLTWAELSREVRRLAEALVERDRVELFVGLALEGAREPCDVRGRDLLGARDPCEVTHAALASLTSRWGLGSSQRRTGSGSRWPRSRSGCS